LVGALIAAVFEVTHVPHPAAWGVIAGIAGAVLGGGAWAAIQTTRLSRTRLLRSPLVRISIPSVAEHRILAGKIEG
jgi:hypothetical protein